MSDDAFRRSPAAADVVRIAQHPQIVHPFVWTERPAGHWQQMGYLLAGVALENAFRHRWGPQARPHDDEGEPLEEVERRLAAVSMSGPVFGVVRALTDALVWQSESAAAKAQLPHLVEYFRGEFGLLIDAGTPTIALVPDFDGDAVEGKHRRRVNELRASAIRQTAKTVLDADGLSPVQAVAAHAALIVPRTARQYRRLSVALTEAGVSERARRTIVFVIEYLSGHTAGMDLARTPVLVAPAEEAKARIQSRLTSLHPSPRDGFSFPPTPHGLWAEPAFQRVLAQLAPADRARVEAALVTMTDTDPVPVLWPDHVDRTEVDDLLWRYWEGTRITREYAQEVTANPDGEILAHEHRWITAMVADLADAAESLTATANQSQGLIDIERHQLVATMFGAEVGEPLPELRFVGDLFKYDREVLREHLIPEQELSDRCLGDLVTLIENGGVPLPYVEPEDPGYYDHRSRYVEPDASVLAVHRTLEVVSWKTRESDNARVEHAAALARLDNQLVVAGASATLRENVQFLLADYAEKMTAHASFVDERHQIWADRHRETSAHNHDSADLFDDDTGRAHEPAASPPGIDLVGAALPAHAPVQELPGIESAATESAEMADIVAENGLQL